jgi:hypothetical protein
VWLRGKLLSAIERASRLSQPKLALAADASIAPIKSLTF